MRANFLVILVAAMIVLVSATAGVNAFDSHESAINSHENAINSPDKNAINSPDNYGKKYIVDKVGEKDLNNLRENGCEIVKQHRKVASVSCPDAVASALNLKEDIKVYALDTGADAQIGANSVWAQGFTGTNRKVAVVDTGIDYSHPELSDSYAGGWNEIANNSNPFDDNGHGTHVAGIITANGGDVKGVAPGAKVLAFKVLDSSGSGSFSDVIAAVYDAVDGQDGIYNTSDDYNVDAISMSLGTGAPYLYTGTNCDSAYTAMRDAVAYANSRGVAVVAAAGNDARGVSIPGCITGVITVAAVDSDDARASFSGIGGSVDIAAPGVGINSTTPGNTYASWSGTSMATPHVSALVALLRQAKPNASVSEITSAIYNTAKDLGTAGWDKYYGYGRINASAAIAYILPPVPVEPVHDVAVTSISVPSSAVQGSVVSVAIAVSNAGNQAETFVVTLYDTNLSAIIGAQNITLSAGASINMTFFYNTSSAFIGGHVLKAEAIAVAGETNTADNVKYTSITITEPPQPFHDVAVSSVSSPASAVQGAVVQISAVVNNLGNVPETLNITASDTTTFSLIGWRSVTLNPGSSQNIIYSWNTSASVIGNHIISVNAGIIDGENNTFDNEKSIVVAIVAPPVSPAMHIANISIIKQTSGSKTRAVVTVSVVNVTGSAVSGASVSGHWSGLTSGAITATTRSSGTATFTSAWKSRANGIFTFTVDNLAKSGWVYDSSANAANSASIMAP